MTNVSEHDLCSSFVKIPKQLFTIAPGKARLYAAFLDFKAFNVEGVITLPTIRDRHYYAYWMKKLCCCRWAVKIRASNRVLYNLKSYQEVWKSMGVERSWCSTIKKHKFSYSKIYISDLPEQRKEYFKNLVELILTKVAGNKRRQISWRLRNKVAPGRVKQTETFISSRAVASLFGLGSPASGSKYRKKYFSVISEPDRLIRYPDGMWRYQCKKIAL